MFDPWSFTLARVALRWREAWTGLSTDLLDRLEGASAFARGARYMVRALTWLAPRLVDGDVELPEITGSYIAAGAGVSRTVAYEVRYIIASLLGKLVTAGEAKRMGATLRTLRPGQRPHGYHLVLDAVARMIIRAAVDWCDEHYPDEAGDRQFRPHDLHRCPECDEASCSILTNADGVSGPLFCYRCERSWFWISRNGVTMVRDPGSAPITDQDHASDNVGRKGNGLNIRTASREPEPEQQPDRGRHPEDDHAAPPWTRTTAEQWADIARAARSDSGGGGYREPGGHHERVKAADPQAGPGSAAQGLAGDGPSVRRPAQRPGFQRHAPAPMPEKEWRPGIGTIWRGHPLNTPLGRPPPPDPHVEVGSCGPWGEVAKIEGSGWDAVYTLTDGMRLSVEGMMWLQGKA